MIPGGRIVYQESESIIDEQSEVEVGEIAVTNAGNLPCRKVIHAVGPMWREGQNHEEKKLSSCIKKCLRSAEKMGFQSIAIPAVSGGTYGYPIKSCTETIIKAIRTHMLTTKSGSLREIRLLDTKLDVMESYKEAMKRVFERDEEELVTLVYQEGKNTR